VTAVVKNGAEKQIGKLETNTMKRSVKGVILLMISLWMGGSVIGQVSWKAGGLMMEISQNGEVITMADAGSGVNYVPGGQPGHLVRVKSGKRELHPSSVSIQNHVLQLTYGEGIALHVQATATRDYIRFEIIRVVRPEAIEAILWGPFNTLIGETIGEVVGVVRNSDFAIGMRALNPKTVGGKLQNEEGVTHSSASISGSAASAEAFGSALQAFCLNQTLDRVIRVWHHHNHCPVAGLRDYTMEGSAIAIFGTSPDKALHVIGRINQAEGLPYPMIDGEWIRASQATGRPYLITGFTEENFDEMLELTERLGFYSIYHEHPFETWGHFDLIRAQFPNGREGMRRIVEKAKAKNIRVGVHTLSNFITTNDRFVTTDLNSGLMAAGVSLLEQDIDETTTDIVVDGHEYFAQVSTLNSVRIGNEIIRYQEVTSEKPYTLINCVRGAYDTRPSTHKKGDRVSKLMDFPYRTLFPDWEMQDRLIQNLADFFNETGVSHMDFDGHEGACYTGRGDYAINHFADAFLRRVNHVVVNGSSVINHFYWNHNSYINWGEPWYASFRESQSEHRFRLQPFFERNYMPPMLGWFLVSPDTRVEDVEWMMSVAAGYQAGYALVLRDSAYKNNPDIDKIIETIVLWEEAKQSRIFSDGQRAAMRDPENDFRLRKVSGNEWVLQGFDQFRFEHQRKELQPGEPTHSLWEFSNAGEPQMMQLQLLVTGDDAAEVENLEIEVDRFFRLKVPVSMKRGQTLVWDGSKEMVLYSDKGRFIRTIQVDRELPELKTGRHTIVLDAAIMKGVEPGIRGTVKLKGKVETIKKS
jgi:hypothetical protein